MRRRLAIENSTRQSAADEALDVAADFTGRGFAALAHLHADADGAIVSSIAPARRRVGWSCKSVRPARLSSPIQIAGGFGARGDAGAIGRSDTVSSTGQTRGQRAFNLQRMACWSAPSAATRRGDQKTAAWP